MVIDCVIIQEVFNEEIMFRYTVQEGDTQYFTQVHCSHYFTCMVMGCNIIQEVKGLTKKLCYVLLSRRKTSFYEINCPHCLPVFTWLSLHYNALLGLSVKQEVKGLTTNYITMHYPGRKPVYLQIFGATVSEFRFFMRLRT